MRAIKNMNQIKENIEWHKQDTITKYYGDCFLFKFKTQFLHYFCTNETDLTATPAKLGIHENLK